MDFENFFENDHEQESNLDLKRYFRGICKRKWLIIVIFLFLVVPWIIFVMKQPPEYEASTFIRFKNYDPEKLRSKNDSRYVELTSRTFAEKVVAQLGLTLSVEGELKKYRVARQDIFKEFFTGTNPVPGYYLISIKDSTFSVLWSAKKDEAKKKLTTGNFINIVASKYNINGFTFCLIPDILKRYKEINFKIDEFRATVKWFQSSIDIPPIRDESLMQISMVHENPVIVAQMINKLAELFVEESISFDKKKALKQRSIIEERLTMAEERYRRDQEELRRFKENNYFVSLDSDMESNINRLAELEGEKRNLEDATKNLSELLRSLDNLKGNSSNTKEKLFDEVLFIYKEIVKNPLFINDANVGVLSQRLNKAEADRNTLLERLTLSHPDIRRIEEEIALVQNEILRNANEKKTFSSVELNRILRQVSSIQYDIRQLPNEQLKLAEFTQKVEVSQKLYASLLAEKQKIEISEAAETEEIDILDPAIPPELPVNKSKKKNAVVGFLFCLFLSIGVAVILEFLDKTVKTPDDIKRYLKLNVIGTIPKIEFDNQYELKDSDKLKQIDSQLVTYDYSPTPIGEAYRALRTKIVFSKDTGKINTLVVTSFAPGDGKSFTSANLAITLAQHKSNTLLIDSDLRRGVLHNTFGISKEPGFSNYLMGMARFDNIINETYIPNLSLVSCGSMMPNPSELLGSIKLKQFIEEARKRYNIVLFDSPPLNAATDSVVLGTQADGVVLIVRADVTNRNIAKQKLDLFNNVPANLIGVILNGTNTELAHDGYSYYHY